MEGDNGGKGFRNNYKGHIDKTKWGWKQGKKVGMAGVRGSCEGITGRQRGKGHQGTCIKDTWRKPNEGSIEGGSWG